MNLSSIRLLPFYLLLMVLLGFTIPVASQEAAPSQAHRQNWQRRQFMVAQGYQRRNEHPRAIRILESLYQTSPGNVQYYQALLSSYLQLSLVDKAQDLIRRQESFDKGNPRYRVDFGEVLLKSGEKAEALKIWKKVLDQHPDITSLYTQVARAMTANRMYDEAVQVYEQAYHNHPDQPYLLHELANFYRTRLQYDRALQAYIKYVRQKPEDYQMIARSVLAFRVEDEAEIEHLLSLLRKELKKSGDRVELKILGAKFFQKYGRYDEAFSLYRDVETEKTRGRYLLEFARAVQSDSLYPLALRAYNEVINRFPHSPFLWLAYQGAARCNLELARTRNDQSYARQAIDMIHQVQERFPNRPEVANLTLLEGDIYRRFFFDLDRAITIYSKVARLYQNKPDIREGALLSAGETYMMRGDLDKAAEMLMQVNSKARKPRALFLLAKIKFYQGDYEGARKRLNRIPELQGLSGTMTNDAFELQGILENEKTAPQALKLYAEADWLLMQQKKSQAISKLKKALENNPPIPFKIRLLLQAARLSRDIGKPDQALEFCNQVLKDESLHLYADEALFLMAGIVENQLKNVAQAYSLYDRLLAEFPTSQFAIAARERLKEIRKQNPELVP